MKSIFRNLATMLMIAVMLSLTCMTAFGYDNIDDTSGTLTDGQIEWIQDNVVAANNGSVSFKQNFLRAYLVTEGEGEQVANINGVSLYMAKGKTVEALQGQIVKNYNNANTVDKVSGITDGLQIEADTQGAAQLLSGFTPIIGLLLGIVVTLITIGMTIFSAIDMIYLAFPVFRNKCEDAKTTGQGAMVKKGANGEATLRFVTDDAQYAISQGTIESGKSPWAIYFGRRIISYILLAIMLFILLTGNISLITNIALRVVSGIMNVLGGLG